MTAWAARLMSVASDMMTLTFFCLFSTSRVAGRSHRATGCRSRPGRAAAEQVIGHLADDGDVDVGAGEGLGGEQTAEAGTDDDDVGARGRGHEDSFERHVHEEGPTASSGWWNRQAAAGTPRTMIIIQL